MRFDQMIFFTAILGCLAAITGMTLTTAICMFVGGQIVAHGIGMLARGPHHAELELAYSEQSAACLSHQLDECHNDSLDFVSRYGSKIQKPAEEILNECVQVLSEMKPGLFNAALDLNLDHPLIQIWTKVKGLSGQFSAADQRELTEWDIRYIYGLDAYEEIPQHAYA